MIINLKKFLTLILTLIFTLNLVIASFAAENDFKSDRYPLFPDYGEAKIYLKWEHINGAPANLLYVIVDAYDRVIFHTNSSEDLDNYLLTELLQLPPFSNSDYLLLLKGLLEKVLAGDFSLFDNPYHENNKLKTIIEYLKKDFHQRTPIVFKNVESREHFKEIYNSLIKYSYPYLNMPFLSMSLQSNNFFVEDLLLVAYKLYEKGFMNWECTRPQVCKLLNTILGLISEKTWHTEMLSEADYNFEGAAAGVEDQTVNMIDQPDDADTEEPQVLPSFGPCRRIRRIRHADDEIPAVLEKPLSFRSVDYKAHFKTFYNVASDTPRGISHIQNFYPSNYTLVLRKILEKASNNDFSLVLNNPRYVSIMKAIINYNNLKTTIRFDDDLSKLKFGAVYSLLKECLYCFIFKDEVKVDGNYFFAENLFLMANSLNKLRGTPEWDEAYALFKEMFDCISEDTWVVAA